MSAATHATGSLAAQHWFHEATGQGGWDLVIGGQRLPLCDMASGEGDDPEANARRLALCWNACQGIPSSVLEDVPGVVSATLPYHQLRSQRDDMLAALRAAIAFIEGVPDAVEPFGLIRAAIAKAEGGAA